MDELNAQSAELAKSWGLYRNGGPATNWNAARLAFAAWAGARYLAADLPPTIHEHAADLLFDLGTLGGLPYLAENNPPSADLHLAQLLTRISALELVRRAWLAAGKALSADVEAAEDASKAGKAWAILSSVSPALLLAGLASGQVTGEDLAAHTEKTAAAVGEGIKKVAAAVASPFVPIVIGLLVIGGVALATRGRRR